MPKAVKVIIALSILTLIVIGIGLFFLKQNVSRLEDTGDLAAAIDKEIHRLYKDDGQWSIVVGVLKSGRTDISKRGTLSDESTTTVNDYTHFQIGSITKVFSVLLLQILNDEGIVSVDSTLEELLGDSYSLAPSVQSVTLRQLASHTSGFPRVPKYFLEKLEKEVGRDQVLLDPYSKTTPDEIFDYLTGSPEKRKPGKADYSNFGMGLLAHVLEHVTGESYDELLQKTVFEPLNLKNTTVSRSTELSANMAQGYTQDGSAQAPWSFTVLAGAGALNSNIRDMLTFTKAHFDKESDLNVPLTKLLKAPNKGPLLGWQSPSFLDKFFGNGQIVWHNGMTGGYASYLAIDPHSQTGVVVLSNKAVDMTMLGIMLMRQVRTQSWADN
ncbi:MAG: beta-lactamase family protein [Gammaproteobacteria bacterium]|nr:beta-lactamase family protein [Gammaproteobacteria bacterium]